jgi:hypothetical protein
MTMRCATAWMLIFSIAATGGCAAIRIHTEIGRAPARDFDAVAVLPLELAFEHRPYEPYEKTQTLVAELRAAHVVTIGPEELADDPAAARSLRPQVARLGFAPERVAVLRARATRVEENYWVALLDQHKGTEGYLHLWVARYAVELQLRDADGGTIARAVGEALEQRDDLAAADEAERYPILRQTLAGMVQVLLRDTAASVRVARVALPPGLEVADVHARLTRLPAIARELAALAPLDREVYELVRYRYFDPAFPAAWLPAVRRAGGGVMVRRAEGPVAAAGLRPADLVVGVDGAPVPGACAFERALARGARQLTVLRGRDGARIAITLAPRAEPRVAGAPAPRPGA